MATVEVETVAARRSIAGVGSFTVHAEPVSRLRLRLARLPRPAPGWWLRTGLILAVAMLLFGAVSLALPRARGAVAEPVAQPDVSAAPVPKPAWIEVNRPIQLFGLSGSTFGKLPLMYRARRLSDGSERRDTLTYGVFGADAPALTLAVLRTSPDTRSTTLLTDLARIAAAEKLATLRSGPPTSLQTRFGRVEAADLTVEAGGRTRPCLGFHLLADESPLPVAISGLACGAETKPVDRAGLACVLDRLDLLSAGEDTALRDFFVGAERRRGSGCGRAGLLVAGSHQTWLDGEAIRPAFERGGAPSRRAESLNRSPGEL